MATKLPHESITVIGQDRPPAVPELWNSRYAEIDENFAKLAQYAPTGVCATSAANAKKAAACADFVLADGAFVVVKFANENTAENPTLNINSTGAMPIFYKGAAIPADQIAAGGVYLFRYDGTNWDAVGNIDDNDLIQIGEIDQLFTA